MAAGVDDGASPVTAILLEPRPFRPFKTSEEYLWAMKEDLAEWLHQLYGLEICAENFCELLETGVTLCQHANRVRRQALDVKAAGKNGLPPGFPINAVDVVYRSEVTAGTFHARDNVSNFISWCRSLGIYDCLLFETDDLVLRKNERSFILCLLEVARRGAKLGMPAPMLVQMEEEIDREIMKEIQKKEKGDGYSPIDGITSSEDGEREEEEEDEGERSPPLQIITNDLKSLDEMVRDLVNRCNCPVQFPMIRVSEGKYRIGDTQTLIFVRILRSHVMVRVGGGWDTLEHYLDKHDPCRCRQGHRSTVSSKFVLKHSPFNPTQPQMQVTYERSPDNYIKTHTLAAPGSPHLMRRASLSSTPSIASKSSTGSLASNSSERERHRKSSGDCHTVVTDMKSRRLSDGDVYLRSITDRLDEGYHTNSKAVPCTDRSSAATATPTKQPFLDSANHSSEKATRRKQVQGKDPTSSPIPDSRLVRKKSQSTEELGGQSLSILPSSTDQRDSSTPSMVRSRSQYSEGSDMARYLNRATPGSYRNPRSLIAGSKIPRGSVQASNTWAHRPRAPRPSLNGSTFNRLPPGSQSPSPQRRSRSGPTRPCASTPSKLIREVLAAATSKEQLLRKMAEIVARHNDRAMKNDLPPGLPPEEESPARYTNDWVASTRRRHSSGTSMSSPVDDSGSDAGDSHWNKDEPICDSLLNPANKPQYSNGTTSRIPIRVGPRKDSAPGSTRIPLPSYYNT